MEARETELRGVVNLLRDAPHAYLLMLRQALSNSSNNDWTSGVVRPSLQNVWPLFLTINIIVGGTGLITTLCMLIDIIESRLYRTATGGYLCNVMVNNLLMVLLILPMSFLVALYENWILGRIVCYLSSILPYIVLLSSLLTFIVMSIDRYRSIACPTKYQMNVFICLISIWLLSTGAAMPIISYIHYRDISHLHARVENNSLCWSTADDYGKVIFVTIFTIPTLIIAFVLVKTFSKLKAKQALCRQFYQIGPIAPDTSPDLDSLAGDDLKEKFKDRKWVEREMTTQRYIALMIGLWVGCWIPIKVFGIVSRNVVGRPETSVHLDIAQMVLLPVTAVCTIVTPVCFNLMKKSLIKNHEKRPQLERRLSVISVCGTGDLVKNQETEQEVRLGDSQGDEGQSLDSQEYQTRTLIGR